MSQTTLKKFYGTTKKGHKDLGKTKLLLGTPVTHGKLELIAESSATTTDNKPKTVAKIHAQVKETKLVSAPRTPSKSQESALHRRLHYASPSKSIAGVLSPTKAHLSPSKLKDSPARRRLYDCTGSPSKSVVGVLSPTKTPTSSPRKLTESERLDLIINQSRSKLLLSPKLDELKKSLTAFSEQTSRFRQFQSNNFKITSVASPSLSTTSESVIVPSRPASERFNYLISKEPSLILPTKYKILFEMFSSMDTVVSIFNNRKEIITFEKVKEGVQKMMKRNFDKIHLGRIVTVYPEAYKIAVEKCSIRKVGLQLYQLMITPNLAEEDNKRKPGNQPMLPPCILNRKNEFRQRLITLVKKHHQDFLRSLNFPTVPEDSIKVWHPKFPVDSVPDVPSASLPEPPEMKISTAKDVLDKIKGSVKSKIEKALKSVADESKPSEITLEIKDIKPEVSKSALKGICDDILERVRARESAMHLETITRGPEETKKLAMLEKLPKMIHILWHYFIAERKAAVPLDTAVDKILHSFGSLMTPDEVKEHMKLISEKYPGWLTFVEIRKGIYIRIDKKRTLKEMLDNSKL